MGNITHLIRTIMNKLSKFTVSGICGMLTLAATALCSPPEAAAQTYIGYINPQETVYPYTGFNNSSESTGTLYFVVRMEADKFTNYDGASLSGLRVGWSMGEEEKTPEMEVFVRGELNGENLASGKAQVKFGWNDISFDTPYTIQSGKELYLGGKVEWEPGSWLGTGIFGYNLPENTQYMGNSEDVDASGNINWIDATDNNMVLMLLGIVEATGDEFNDLAVLTDLRANDVQRLDTPGDAWLAVKNEGVNNLQSIEFTSMLGDKTWTGSMEFSTPISGGEQKEVTGGIQALGTGTHKVWISKVNGKEVEKPIVLEREFIAVPSDIASGYVRRPVIERWVSESEYRTPSYTDDIFMPGVEPLRDRISLISHHLSDQFMIYHEFDADVDNEDVQFLVDFADGDKSRVSVPCFAIDRSFLPRNPLARSASKTVAYNFIYPDYVEGLYLSALDVPTFASVNAAVTLDGTKCDIDIAGNVEPGIMPQGEPLYLTVYVVEDGIESTSQEFPDDPDTADRYKGVYTHQDVIRLSLTGMYGERLDGEGSFSKQISCELEPEWNTDNMRVLAFLNRSGERHGHMQIINSCETAFNNSGVESVADGDGRTFLLMGRDIVAAHGHSVEVYTLDGIRVSNLGLGSGIYIVKVSGPEGISAAKVAIK